MMTFSKSGRKIVAKNMRNNKVYDGRIVCFQACAVAHASRLSTCLLTNTSMMDVLRALTSAKNPHEKLYVSVMHICRYIFIGK